MAQGIRYEVTVDNSNFERGIRQSRKSAREFSEELGRGSKQTDNLSKSSGDATKTLSTLNKRVNGLAGSFKTLIGGAVIGGFLAISARVTRAFIEFSDAAADADETASKFGVVFGELGSQASNAAERLSNNFDLADSTAQRLLASTGDILTGFDFTRESALQLSDQVATLGADLASFTNVEGGAEKAVQALTRALIGETEQAKALGIVIRQDSQEFIELVDTFMATENATLLQAKALAALEIAQRQSQNALGDYARTQDSAANIARAYEQTLIDFREEVGAETLPAFTAIRKALTEVLGAYADAREEQRLFRDAQDNVNDGTATQADQLIILERELEVAQAQLLGLSDTLTTAQQVGVSVSNQASDAIRQNVENEIARLERIIAGYNRRAESAETSARREREAAEFLANSQVAAQKAVQESINNRLAIEKQLEEEGLSGNERLRNSIQQEINTLVERRNAIEGVAGAEEEYAALQEEIEALAAVRSQLNLRIAKTIEDINIALSDNIRLQAESNIQSINEEGLTQSERRLLRIEEEITAQEKLRDSLEEGSADREAAILAIEALTEEQALVEERVRVEGIEATEEAEAEKVRLAEQAAERRAKAAEEEAERIKQALSDSITFIADTVAGIFSIFSNGLQEELNELESAFRTADDIAKERQEAELERLEERKNRALEDANVLELTEIERLQNELQAARDAGDTEDALRLEREIKRAEIEEQFAIEEKALRDRQADEDQTREQNQAIATAKIRREQAEQDRVASLFEIAAQTAVNIVQAFPNPLAIGAAITAGVVQSLAVTSAPLPQIPTFQTGGVVPGDSFAGDRVLARGELWGDDSQPFPTDSTI